MILIALGCASSQHKPAASAAASGDSVQIHVVESKSENPLVAFRVLFRGGSAEDPPGLEGVTALAARWMAEGGTEKLTAVELSEQLFPMAASLDVEVERDTTVFSGLVHRDHVEAYVPLLIDVLTAPRWDKNEFLRLRTDAENEVARALRLDNDEELGKQSLQALLYEGHPYGHPVAGTVGGLSRITPKDCQDQAKRVFSRRRLVLGVAGDFQPTLVARVQDALAHLPPGDEPKPLPEPPSPAVKVLLVEKETDSTAISLGFSYELRRENPDFAALVVAMSAFGEHRQFHGRLFQELRAKRGLNYGDYAYLESFVQAGWTRFVRTNISRRQQYFSIWIRPVENKNRVFALRAALYELDRLVQDGLTEDEVSRTKEFLTGYTRLWSATDARRLGYSLDDVFYGFDKPGYLESLRQALPRLTAAQVNAAIRRWIDPQKLHWVVVTKDAASLRDALLRGEPSPIEYATPKATDVLKADKAISAFPMTVGARDIHVVSVSSLFEQARLSVAK